MPGTETQWRAGKQEARTKRREREKKRIERNRAIGSHRGDWPRVRNSMVRDRGFLCIYSAIGSLPAALIVRIYWPVSGDVLDFKPRRSTLSDFAGFQCNATFVGLADGDRVIQGMRASS